MYGNEFSKWLLTVAAILRIQSFLSEVTRKHGGLLSKPISEESLDKAIFLIYEFLSKNYGANANKELCLSPEKAPRGRKPANYHYFSKKSQYIAMVSILFYVAL